MHHLTKKISLAVFSAFLGLAAQAEPSAVLQQSLTRNAQSPSTLQTQLVANTYRQESYQDNYTVQVPYQDTEEYTEEETYYTNDYVCHDETNYENQCHTERQCDYAQKLALKLNVGGGINARPRIGDPGPAPYDPGQGSGPIVPTPQPRCYDRQVCEMVPVTRQQCSYEQTPHTRTVTRTRPVTRYRDESRCCVTRTRDVFDHQWSLQVQLQFPAEAALLAGEQESFQVVLGGSEAAPDVSLKPVQSVFGYAIASKSIQQGIAVIVLKVVPRFRAQDLQQSTVQSLQVVPTQNGLSYSFLDNAQYPRVSSTQQLLLQDAQTHQVLAQTDVTAISQRQNNGSLNYALDAAKLYEVVLKIHREGVVIDTGVVDFAISQPLVTKVDMTALRSDAQITATLNGAGAGAQLSFVDATLPYAGVVTNYTITVARRNDSGKAVSIGAKSFSRTSLSQGDDGSYVMPLTDIVKEADAAQYVKSGARILVVVEVRRQTQDGTKIQFWKDNWVNVK